MAKNWELVEVSFNCCDECWTHTNCNIYRKVWSCNCLKCGDREQLYRFKNLCGACLPKWLKSRDLDIV